MLVRSGETVAAGRLRWLAEARSSSLAGTRPQAGPAAHPVGRRPLAALGQGERRPTGSRAAGPRRTCMLRESRRHMQKRWSPIGRRHHWIKETGHKAEPGHCGWSKRDRSPRMGLPRKNLMCPRKPGVSSLRVSTNGSLDVVRQSPNLDRTARWKTKAPGQTRGRGWSKETVSENAPTRQQR